MKHYQCHAENCEDKVIYRYKGLCRSCTEYDSSGNVVNAVNRIQVNSDGTVYHKIVVERPKQSILTKQMFLNQRRKQKITKKQRKQMEEQIKAQQAQQAQEHDCCASDEACEHKTETLDFSDIGESVNEEE